MCVQVCVCEMREREREGNQNRISNKSDGSFSFLSQVNIINTYSSKESLGYGCSMYIEGNTDICSLSVLEKK